jgi:sugar diacid utilization regulator
MTAALHLVDESGHLDVDQHMLVLGAFEEVALLAGEQTPLNEVLRLVGRRLCELLEVARCSVYLRREDGLFQGRVGYCQSNPNFDSQVSKLLAGVDRDRFTAEVVATRAPVFVHDARTDPRTVQRTMRQWGVHDMLGVPLVVDSEVIGIIFVDDEDRDHAYSTRDVLVAQAFAGLSALAVRQAWLHQQLAGRAQIIEQQSKALTETNGVHSAVIRALLDGADLQQLLELTVDLLGKPVVLYSPSFHTISWAAPSGRTRSGSPALTRAQVAIPWVRAELDKLEKSTTVTLRATRELTCRRLLTRLAANGRCIGYLELCELDAPFRSIDARALEQAAMAMAVKIMATRQGEEEDRERRDEFCADLLYGRRDHTVLATRAARFGVDPKKPHVVVRVQHRGAGQHGGTARHWRQAVAAAFRAELESASVVASTSAPSAELFLVELTRSTATSASVAAALRPALPGLQDALLVERIVVSDVYRSLTDLPRATEQLRDLTDLLTEVVQAPLVTTAREYELFRLIGRREGLGGMRRHASQLLRPLLAHDAETGGDLLATLRAYAASHAHVGPTASALDVHPNTVRYRLGRIRELSTIDPEDLSSLVAAALAIQALELLEIPDPLAGSIEARAETAG